MFEPDGVFDQFMQGCRFEAGELHAVCRVGNHRPLVVLLCLSRHLLHHSIVHFTIFTSENN